jgi:hypothetical protein
VDYVQDSIDRLPAESDGLAGKAVRRGCPFLLLVLLLGGCLAQGDDLASSAGERAAIRITAASPTSFERFGSSVALDNDASRLVVGAWGSAEAGRNTGAAYVFGSGISGWSEEGRLVAENASAGALFGHAVDIDGDTVAVGAVFESGVAGRAGAVYIFRLRFGTWRQQATLTPPGGKSNAYFGAAVSLSGDTLAVGAPGPGDGAVYVFRREGGEWTEVTRLAGGGDRFARFGSALELSEGRLAVGAWTERDEAHGVVTLFELHGGAWQRQTEVRSFEMGDRFGYSLDLSNGLLAVGAPESPGGGAVHLFGLEAGVWELGQVLRSSEARGRFGTAVALDGEALAVGAPGSGEEERSSGAVYLFRFEDDAWRLEQFQRPGVAAANRELGSAVALRGTLLAVGAFGEDESSGAAYLVRLDQRPSR